MSSVRRVYVEKKPEYAVQAKALKSEMKSYLGIKNVENVRVLIRYDVENITDATFETACNGIFSEPPVDTLYKESFDVKEGSRIFSVEYLTREQTLQFSVCSSLKKMNFQLSSLLQPM